MRGKNKSLNQKVLFAAIKCVYYPFWDLSQTALKVFPTLSKTSTNETPTLSYTWSLKKGNPFERNLPNFFPLFFKRQLKDCVANRNIGKYHSPFYFVFFLYFFYHSFCRKDQFTVLILKFGIEDFTDPGLLKIWLTLNGLSLWFCLQKCFGDSP